MPCDAIRFKCWVEHNYLQINSYTICVKPIIACAALNELPHTNIISKLSQREQLSHPPADQLQHNLCETSRRMCCTE